jgi:ribosome-associated heat shock protein Hsp15
MNPMCEGTRIDKWLWHARFFRSRALAQAAAASGLVRLNGTRVEKAGRAIKPGDVVTVPKGREVVAVRVLAVAARRGPARDALLLYEVVAGGGLDRDPPGP